MQDRQKLIEWYQKNFRSLPWRETKDPYKIWVSEIMCQQTRVAAVIPFYDRFMNHFPTVKDLADAPEEKVLENWAGLGYYSRARNIHKAAKLFVTNGFPQSWDQLIQYPGIGDYTARAISSFAFKQNVGVVDGNVIRFLSRYYAAAEEPWTQAGKTFFQEIADEWAKESPETVNQALMEMGATICLPQNPHCGICPLSETCVSRQFQWQQELPLKKAKKKEENWTLDFQLVSKKGQVLLLKNHNLPVMKNQVFPPCTSKMTEEVPSRKPQFKHSVTHHKFYVFVSHIDLSNREVRQWNSNFKFNLEDSIWVEKKDLKKYCHSSLVEKLLPYF